jgi:hypothetical protein
MGVSSRGAITTAQRVRIESGPGHLRSVGGGLDSVEPCGNYHRPERPDFIGPLFPPLLSPVDKPEM